MPQRGMKRISEYYVRSFEMDYYQYLPPSALMRVAGAASFAALLEYGYEYPLLREKLGGTWMLGMLDFYVYEDIRVDGEPVKLTMYASPLYRAPSVFMVRIEVRAGDRVVAVADTCSMVVSIRERHALRTDDVCAVLDVSHREIIAEAPARLQLPEDMEFVQTHTVQYYDCDRNQHMNAYRYTDLVCQAVGYWSAGTHRRMAGMRMEYDAECLPGEIISLYQKKTDRGIYVKGVKEDGRLSFKSLVRMADPDEEEMRDGEAL